MAAPVADVAAVTTSRSKIFSDSSESKFFANGKPTLSNEPSNTPFRF